MEWLHDVSQQTQQLVKMFHNLNKAADLINCRSSFKAARIICQYILNNPKFEEFGFINITLLNQISYIKECIRENRQLTPNRILIYNEHMKPTENLKSFRIPIQKC